jgi:uncharacterized protein (DUF58 family)
MLKIPDPSRPRSLDDLLDSALVARLGGVDISARKVLAGKLKGERRSKRRGESVEFADHRPYTVGDDLRHIDWNIFGRLDKLFLKLFLEEEDLSLHVVLDASGSHDAGTPSKFLLMQKLAAALGYVGLANLHRVQISAIGGLDGNLQPQLLTSIRDLRGRRRLTDLARFLVQLEPGGPAAFTEGCKRINLTRRGKGVMLILSDFLIKEGYEAGLRLLLGGGYEVYALQVLSPQEIDPTKDGGFGGDLRLKDCEDGDAAEVTISAALLKQYRATVQAYCGNLSKFCSQRGIGYQLIPSSTPVDQVVLEYLRRKGLVQ